MLEASLQVADLTPSQWAERYRIFKDNKGIQRLWTFKGYEFLEGFHNSNMTHRIFMKAAQIGVTESLMNVMFHLIDCQRRDILYILPTNNDVSDFSSGRFKNSLSMSPRLQDLFTDTDNVRHKSAGACNLYLRGSNSKSGLMSIPVSVLIVDEFDLMDLAQVGLARERMSGQETKLEIDVGVPTIPDFGIDAEWKKSTQGRWVINCKYCGKPQWLTWDKNIFHDEGEEGYAYCQHCLQGWLDTELADMISKGRWEFQQPEAEIDGRHLSQLYSPTIPTATLVKTFHDIKGDESKAQNFYNSKLGIPYVAKGARLDDEILNACVSDEIRMLSTSTYTTMGVDVGRYLHYEIDRWEEDYKTIVSVGTLLDFEELDEIMQRFGVFCCVIDALPETRKAREFASRFPYRVFLSYYPSKEFKEQSTSVNEDAQIVQADRTATLDKTFSRYKIGKVRIPLDIPKEYFEHLKAPIRIYQTDKNGIIKAKYVEQGADHWAHAANYSDIAFQIRPPAVIDVNDGISGDSFI